MILPRFIQIHSLVSYPSVLLNRDDSGLAKRMSYGGAMRTRVSSQCLKRHWRTADDEWSLRNTGAELSVRSRDMFDYEVAPRVRERVPTVSDETLAAVGEAVNIAIYGAKGKEKSKRQALFFGWPELRYITECVVELVSLHDDAEVAADAAKAAFEGKDAKANFAAMRAANGSLSAGLEASLFGRMMTSDPSANMDAAIHVAHAFTVHAQESETDYLTVVDDLQRRAYGEEPGSAGIFDTEITSGVFYEYIVVDVPLLVSNICGVDPKSWALETVDRDLPAKVVEHLLHLIATITPGAKKGSTAPYAFASTIVVEAGAAQPRSLAKAFERPVRPQRDRGMGQAATSELLDWLSRFDRMYGQGGERRLVSIEEPTHHSDIKDCGSLNALGLWVRETIQRAGA